MGTIVVIRDPRAIRRTQYLTKSRDEKREKEKENAKGENWMKNNGGSLSKIGLG